MNEKNIKNMQEAGISFQINNLDHPLFWWPESLVNYQVNFENVEVKPEELVLINKDKGEKVLFQLSEIKTKGDYLKKAVVNFMSELPVNGERNFELKIDKEKSNYNKKVEVPEVKSKRVENLVEIKSDKLKIRIPATLKEFECIPGPVLKFNRGQGWIGDSQIISSQRELIELECEKIEDGPLFITYRLSYEFSGNAQYIATVKVISGMDFIRFYEEMKNIPKEEEMYLKTNWKGFDPTHRQAPNHPHQNTPNESTGHDRFNWERVDQKLATGPRGKAAEMSEQGEIPFRLGVYQPWQANTKLTSANFWDEKTNDAVGIFIDKVEEWQDYEYAIWSSSDTLEVRYFYNNGLLSFKWPLVTGTRSTGLACYNHNKDKEVMENQEESIQKMRNDEIKYGSSYRINFNPLSYTSFLQNRYGTIDLNKVKDWILEYEDKAPRAPEVFEESSSRIEIETVEDLKKELYISPVSFLPVHGTRQNSGFAPVLTRRIERYVNGYNRLHHKLDEDERKRVEALLLLTSYSHADEEYMPMKNMLSGHPNFLSDVKSIPPLMSFLFPNHPMAGEWADEFEKFMELNTRFHTRDTIDEYELQGGRWTENLGTYLWAFLTPAIRANYLLRNYYDGRNRFAKKDIKKIGNWALNALTAPFVGEEPGTIDKSHHHSWGKVEKGEKKRRVHPPQGAHSFRRKHPRLMWLLGKQMRKFDPLLAEYIFWVSRADEDRFGHESGEENDPWKFMYEEESDNPGTNPHLESSKFTGYGIVLRSAVDTEDEVSVHLQQIDNGPNYRWGIAGQGGCGVIYYYAAGKAYSDNGSEDIGDRPCHDTDFCTNFGVWKDNRYKSIGRNVLHRPFYDFDSAQFGEIVSSRENEYSWPQYQSRSVMLAGSDYIITYDAVYSDELAHRWSWFVRESDEMPNIYMIKGQGRTAGRSSRKTSISNDSDNTKGVWYDGRGDCMAVVTHKDGLEVEATEYGCKVKKDSENKDYVFQNREELEYVDADIKFRGKAGIIRKKSNNIELNLFHGSLLGTEDIILEVDNEDLGINLNYSKKNDLTGSYFTREESELKITYPQGLPDDVNVYLDGKGIKTDREENTLRMKLESGEHKLQITESDKPVPVKPEIVGTVNSSNQARVFWSKSAGAESYRIEISYDSGASFEKIGETEETEYLLTDLENGEKIHVRVTARNDSYESEPADEYPVYVTKKVPLPPDGLNLDLKEGEVSLNWGKVLGVSKYRLYRRKKGNENYSLIYEGNEQDFIDKGVNTVPAFSEPGVYAEKLDIDESEYMVYEYAVSSVNGNGEGEKSTCINTDPTSWINWEPTIK